MVVLPGDVALKPLNAEVPRWVVPVALTYLSMDGCAEMVDTTLELSISRMN